MTPLDEHKRAWREKRAALVTTHDDGAISSLEDAIAGNADVKCGSYCLGGAADVDAYEVLADLAEAGWRLVRATPETEDHDRRLARLEEMAQGYDE